MRTPYRTKARPRKNPDDDEGEKSVCSKSDDTAKAAAKDDDALTDEQRWTNCYGALILFYEENGHTFVPSDHKNHSLYRWVEDQRGKAAELSTQQVKQLLIFNFKFAGQAWSPGRPWHCKCLGCKKFAAFNGLCHGHFMKPPPTLAKKKKPKIRKVVPKVEFPLVGLKQTRKNGNYDIENTKNKAKDITRDEVINKLRDFVEQLSQANCASTTSNKGVTTCDCMKFLSDKPFIVESVSHSLMDYFDLNHLQRKHHTVERLRYAETAKRDGHSSHKGPQRIFSLPLSYEYFEEHHLRGATEEDGDGEESGIASKEVIGQAFKHRICAHAFHSLHHIGNSARSTLNEYANGNVSVGQNGNKGREWPGNKKFAEAYESMRDYMNALSDEHRERQRLGPDDDVVLPLHLSRRKCFERWSRERGWDVKKNNAETGQYAGSE
eukprot:CAMPEP_0172536986 /NCGR_PEP_ID=MMETSP1067-20121228/8685_1 /TAXON_ID=265564 ORGANISM="Thalassiosira punctigera, Strain Tpunct2005C2" /NCGR_SAMPLE_ID=MMETSP1067 /ASSEMBLY_ACC=CAM_ASM_000444 /LENGTH=435 /DNA_ID=CAMNT_0013322185 /DNA_START=97 /DNA_END=1401 /DNA_ORIENTATION=-